jgi:hypothetical protein
VHQAEEDIATVTHGITLGTAADLALDDVTANVPLGAVGMQRDFRPVERSKQLGLIGVQSQQQAIECDEAGASTENPVEPARFSARRRSARRNRPSDRHREPQDEPADVQLCITVQIGEGVELVPANGKLTDIIADDDGVAQEAVDMNAAP